MKLVDCLKLEEGKTLEFKRDLSSKKNNLRTISSFSNTSGGAILIGVDDSKTVIGLYDPSETAEMLIKNGETSCQSDCPVRKPREVDACFKGEECK